MTPTNAIWLGGLCSISALLLACGSRPESEDTASATAAVVAPATLTIGGRTLNYRQRVPLATLAGAKVTLSSGRVLDVEKAANLSLVRQRKIAGEALGATTALLGTPEVTEEFIETEHTMLLVGTTHLVVRDPAALRTQAPTLGKFHLKGPGAITLSRMDAGQRAFFDAFKAQMLEKPASHPLGLAARQGSAQLLDAALAGKGDLTITTVVEAPLDELATAGATYMAPAVQNGAFDFGQMHSATVSGFTGLLSFQDEAPPNSGTASGQSTVVTPFVNGFTLADAFSWGEEWNFGVGSVSFEAGASYGVGLRIPIEVTGTMTPTQIGHFGDNADFDSTFASTIKANVIDADADFYEDAGLASIDVQDGQELVLNAEAHVTVDVDILGVKVKETFPHGLAVDYGRNFRPPFDGCGTNCGTDLWLPASLTKTDINLGVAGANAQIGVNVSGEGTVTLDYESLYDHDAVNSTRGQTTKKTHELSFTQDNDRNFTTTLPALDTRGDKTFGYKISNLEYTWDVAVTPGVKGEVWVDCWVLDWRDGIGPFWLDIAKIDLGSVKFGPHAGSRTSRSVNHGTKSWHGAAAYDSVGGSAVSSTSASSLYTQP
ncbi:MAG TPA: hypothetical protein VG937_11805 [Polyangiaceae bacterium]|nr:hypothetical protein [Polyangiaceae bacterium]